MFTLYINRLNHGREHVGNEENAAEVTYEQDELDAEEIEASNDLTDKNDEDFKNESVSPLRSTKKAQNPSQTRSRGRRKSSNEGQELEKEKEKEMVEVATCHMCNNTPTESSIYCSEECIKAHANQVKTFF